jgi:hypothetical protein
MLQVTRGVPPASESARTSGIFVDICERRQPSSVSVGCTGPQIETSAFFVAIIAVRGHNDWRSFLRRFNSALMHQGSKDVEELSNNHAAPVWLRSYIYECGYRWLPLTQLCESAPSDTPLHHAMFPSACLYCLRWRGLQATRLRDKTARTALVCVSNADATNSITLCLY